MEGGFPQKEIGIGQRGIENDQVPIRCFPIYSIQQCTQEDAKLNTIYDIEKGIRYIPKSGGIYRIRIGAGTEVLRLHRTISGHSVIPIDVFD